MKKTTLVTVLVLAIILAACGQASTTTAIPTVVLDSGTNNQPESGNSAGVEASGEVVPAQHVRLSFPLTGIVRSVEVKEGDSVTAGQPLVALDTVILEARVAEAEAAVATAETQVRYLVRVGTSQEQLDSAKASVDRAAAQLESAKATLAQATLTAPFAATVAMIDIAAGETVTPGQVVLLLGDMATMQIETTDLSERDAPAVRLGASAQVYVEALNQEFSGKVVDVARVSSTVGGDVVYKVTIALDEQPAGLLWGMSAEVNIETAP